MQFENRNKWERVEKWVTVAPPANHLRRDAFKWCKLNGSITGKFYCHYTNTRWWFERESDAVWFGLYWSGRKV